LTNRLRKGAYGRIVVCDKCNDARTKYVISGRTTRIPSLAMVVATGSPFGLMQYKPIQKLTTRTAMFNYRGIRKVRKKNLW